MFSYAGSISGHLLVNEEAADGRWSLCWKKEAALTKHSKVQAVMGVVLSTCSLLLLNLHASHACVILPPPLSFLRLLLLVVS